MSESDPRKDPRYRPFRAAAYGLYIAVVSAFCIAVIIGVTRSVRAMTPARKPAEEQVLSYRECLDAADSLWSQLESEREKLVRISPAREVDRQWLAFRTTWLQHMRDAEARCALGSRDRVNLKEVFRRLEEVQDLYSIHAVQYAGEVGGVVDALRGAFSTARKNPAAGRLP
ncbi:hypothetical protein ATI61_118150 [Archangium gephyra]|uniref:Uncharacterized protein n=1 Tax=Archangium gephyra TaxID=48 RepID=A0AAC8TEQ0_9BACT|nr:hypothetical protein [Archangium gephyra]AKJ03180.1 Hypothetical protein AA314_04806 [Archangium gephyra]REG22945.1 hypothetical protein ATI61_118150 [Archangium gephyra]